MKVPMVLILERKQIGQLCLFLVEKRRRDKINNWIMKLAKLVPLAEEETTKQTVVINCDGSIIGLLNID